MILVEIEQNRTLQRIKTLTELHGAPGFENDVKAYMKAEMTPYISHFVENKLGGFLE